jgi:hypothetical protein
MFIFSVQSAVQSTWSKCCNVHRGARVCESVHTYSAVHAARD